MNWDSEWKDDLPRLVKFPTEAGLIERVISGCAVRLRIPIDRFNTFELEAWQIGDLAVHEAFPQHKIDRVTHVPTLTRFSTIPSGSWTTVELIDWCERVLRALTPLTYDTSCIKTYEAKLRIMEWCLSVEVGESKGGWK